MWCAVAVKAMWVLTILLGLPCFVRPDIQPRSGAPQPSVTSGSITTVDKRQHELKASSDILVDSTVALPTLANGHLGFTVFGDAVYMANLYNGAGGLSHRARIPNVANLRLACGCYDGTDPSCTLTLDTAQGLFRIAGAFGSARNVSYRVVHQVFPHALHRRLVVNQFFIERLSADTGPAVEVPLRPPVPFASSDIRFPPARTFRARSSPTSSDALVYQTCGRTVEVESATYQPETRPVCVLWNHVPERLTLARDERNVSFQFVMAVDGDASVAKQELLAALLRPGEELRRAHTSLWRSFWHRTDILTAGSEPLQHTVRASIFYLVSNFPFAGSFDASGGPFGGLSPTGLGRGGASNLDDYEGHSFWDTEIWMMPVLNLLDPWYGRLLVDYRVRLLAVAKDLATELGYAGARYPWESGYTGVEVTQPCCPEVAQYQHHITGDVSFGLRQHLATTQDLVWLQESGCRVAQEVANFWASRLSFNYTGTEQYDIAAVMGPDEDHENVTNNAYTNVIAGYALYFGDFASCLCDNGAGSHNWSSIARRIKLPYDATRDYHPQFEGYRPGTVIKQADTVLLGYPLQYPGMNRSTRGNDLRAYETVTRPTGPAMTWAMHTINLLDLGELDRAAGNFNRSYQPYVRGPFHVWYEVQQPNPTGAQNFLTGAGGFLQAILFGYGGVRVHLDRLEVRAPISDSPMELPPGCSSLTVRGLRYLGALITVAKGVAQSELTVTHLEVPLTIEFIGASVVTDITVNETYLLHNSTAIIRAKRMPYRECKLPEDLIGS